MSKITKQAKKICPKGYSKKALLLLMFFFSISAVFSQTNVQGEVLDNETNEKLSGATVLLKGKSIGTITNNEGAFKLSVNDQLPFVLTISHIGYKSIDYVVDNIGFHKISLSQTRNFTDDVVVTASRRPEKIQDSPAAISVMNAEEYARSGGINNPARALINVPGVEVSQQTGNRTQISFRGGASIFETSVFPMLDYRALSSPGIGFFDASNSPINGIDIEKVEVVLGPASTLYGPDVVDGVVHYMSKDPFKYPGTTVELSGGQINTYQAAVRHAGHNKNATFGYKINARYGAGDDFTLDPERDAAVLANFKSEIREGEISGNGFLDPQKPGRVLVTTNGLQNEEFSSAAVNTHLYFRPNSETQIVATGGWNSAKGIFYNDLGEGYSQSSEYFGQLRFSNKNWFGQLYYINNNGGTTKKPSYLDRSGFIVPLKRDHLEGQLQYRFDLPMLLNSQWTAGVDYRNIGAKSQNHVYGRNENDDDYNIVGAYLQGKMEFGNKFDFYAGGRFDTYNFTSKNTFAPRLSMVYKPHKNHSFRAGYSYTVNPIPASDIYFDLPLMVTPIFNVWNIGGITDQTFNTDPTISWLIPGVGNTTSGTGFPLQAAYQAVTEGVKAALTQMAQSDANINQLLPILLGVLDQTSLSAMSNSFVSTDLDGNPMTPKNVSTNLLAYRNAFELGYRGRISDKFTFGTDVFLYRNKGGSGLGQVSPVITLTPEVANDLGSAVSISTQESIYATLLAYGQSESEAQAIATMASQALGDAYTQAGQVLLSELAVAGLPFHGIMPTNQVPDNGFPMLAYGYTGNDLSKVDQIWGFEIHGKYDINNQFSVKGNYSWRSKPDGSVGTLNFPQNKIRLGFSYEKELGFIAGVNFQWDQAYVSNNSLYLGKIDARSLVDASLGYKFSNKMRLEASGTNIFDYEYRALPGMPIVGRRVIGKVTYEF